MAHPWEEKWVTGDRLGKGGQGFTCCVTRRDDPTIKGALKYLRNNGSTEARGRMRREVVALQTLAKEGAAVPNVLEHNTGQFDDLKIELYVVMDLIPGTTLSDYVASKGALPIDQALEFALSLCKTVERAHKAPILHRDLKPENIMVRDGNSNDLVIVDYGLSFNADDDDLTKTDETIRNGFLDLPETNTPNSDRRDKRTDLAALCGVFWFCLSGERPGHLQDGHGLLPHRRKGNSLREKHTDPRIPGIEEFLDRGFAPVLANRYQTVEDIQQRLREYLVRETDRDLSDPFQLAAHLSAELRAHDRVTQIAEFRAASQKLFALLNQEVGKYNNKLGRYMLNIQGNLSHVLGFTTTAVPQGLDAVQTAPQQLVLMANNHPIQHCRVYAVASSGERCVLLAADWKTTPSQRGPQVNTKTLNWQEVAWYEGAPEPAFNLVAVNLKEWVNARLKDLHAEILKA